MENLRARDVFNRRIQAQLTNRYLSLLQPNTEKDNPVDEKGSTMKTTRSTYWRNTAQNVLWLIACVIVIYMSEIYTVLLYDQRIVKLWFNVGAFLIGLTIAIAMFLIVWISCIKKKTTDDWDKEYPSAVPVATFSFIVGSLCIMKSLWPVWGFITPVILSVLFMGVVVIISMAG